MSSINGLSPAGSYMQASTVNGAQVSATTGLVLSGDTRQAQAMGYDVQNAWETGNTSVTLGSDGSVTTESSTTLYNSDVQQSRTAVNTTMGAYWTVQTDSTEQQTTSFNDAIANPDGSTANKAGQSSTSTVSESLSYLNPFGRSLTAAQFNADVKLYGAQADSQPAGSTSSDASGSAALSQSEDVMALLGSVPHAQSSGTASTPGVLPQTGQSASDEVAAELITLATGVTPQDSAIDNLSVAQPVQV